MLRNLKNIGHLLIANVAIFYYRNPSRKLKIIGVTGTDGKTTTANYIYQLLKLSGKKTALISTVGVFMDGDNERLGSHVTTPSPFVLNKYLRKAVKKKIEYVVLEVSSHALDQHRIAGIDFDIGIITNVTREHLDYHKNIENYLRTKVKLLKFSKNVILNKEDPLFRTIKNKLKNIKIHTYSLENNEADLKYDFIKNQQTEKLTEYNKNNLLTALLTLKVLGIDIGKLKTKIGEIHLPEGRLQYIQTKPYPVIIDFAHTPHAFNSLLPEIRKETRGKLIHVFGSAGKRDKSKRLDMGDISSKYSDVIILTAEDPRGESVSNINNDIRKGISSKFSLKPINDTKTKNLTASIFQIEDRESAITFALDIANPGDCVVITGKGPEDSMNMGNGEMSWNDIKVTRKLLNK